MNGHLVAAEAALKAGQPTDAIDHLIAAVTENPAQSVQVYRALLVQLYRAQRHEEGETWAAVAVKHHPRDFDLWNTRGVMLRQLRRYPQALAALDQASKISPKHVAAQVNRGNVYLDMDDGVRAEAVFSKLVRLEPRNADYQRQLGRALVKQPGRRDAAMVRFRQAVNLKKDHVDAWLDLIGVLNEEHRLGESDEVAVRALAANPGNARLLESRAIILRRSGKLRPAEAYLLDLLPQHPDAAWLHYQLGSVISDWDRDRGNVHMRRAVELDPDKIDFQMALIESLERTRTGDEGVNIEESYQLARRTLAHVKTFTASHAKVIHEVFIRVCAFEDMAQVGDFTSLGRLWAEAGKHTALLKQLARVKNDEDRFELLEQHRIWGRLAEARAAEHPIKRPPARPPGGKIRLGFMSSDLRRHPVGYFALPLFDHLDSDRFEVFVYSYYQGQEDPLQAHIAGKVSAYRWWSDISAREAAQAIADDQLDLLIELGGSTHMNKLEVMGYRPAPRQASWLGYPHSAGLSTIDYLIVDPLLNPPRPEFMIEAPMVMPSTWLALGKLAFPEHHVIEPTPPHARNGFITYGTANNSYKYTAETLSTWARIVAATPDSHFMFVRPEGTSMTFRTNVLAYFAQAGVSEDRVEFVSVRGMHMAHYNGIDI
ncbi:MAG: tetratricopeptide repeat protein, partial [Phenylobacterium sp.]